MSSRAYKGIITHAVLVATIALASALSLGCGSQPNDTPPYCSNLNPQPNCPQCNQPPKPGPGNAGGGSDNGGGGGQDCPLKSGAPGRGGPGGPGGAGGPNGGGGASRSGPMGSERQWPPQPGKEWPIDYLLPPTLGLRAARSTGISSQSAAAGGDAVSCATPCNSDITPLPMFEGGGAGQTFDRGNTFSAPSYAAAVGGATIEADAAKRIVNISRTDFAMLGNGGSRIALSRDYNNMTGLFQENIDGKGVFGSGWYLYYDMFVAAVADDLDSFVQMKGGSLTVLYHRGNGVWMSTPATGECLRMERLNGEYKLMSVGSEIYHVFDASGRLKCIHYRGGNLVRIDRRTDGLIDKIAFDHETNNIDNRYLQFEYETIKYNRFIEHFPCTGGGNPGDPCYQPPDVDHAKERTRLKQVKVFPSNTVVARYDYGVRTDQVGTIPYTWAQPDGDDSGMLTAVRNSQGVLIEGYANEHPGSADYDEPWRLVSLKQRANDGAIKTTRSYDYDGIGHVTRIDDGDGNKIVEFSEDTLHDSKATMADGTTYEYTSNNAREPIDTTVTASDGTVLETINQTFDVDAGWTANVTSLLKTYSRDGGDTVTYTYVDSSSTSWTNSTVDEYYSPRRKLVSGISWANGASETIQYDDQNRITTITLPLGRVKAYTYDANGNTSSYTNPEEGTYRYEYDSRGNLTKRTLPSGKSEEYGYGPYGEVTETTDTEGRSSYNECDDYGRLTTTTVEGNWVAYEYDSLDRVTTVTAFDGSVSGTQYDGDTGRVIGKTDKLGRTVHYDYNTSGKLTCVTDPPGKTIHYGYDSNDRLTTVTDQKNNASARIYDGQGHLIIKRNALGKETHYSYYSTAPGCAPCGAAKGQLATLVRADGSSEEYTYENDRLKRVQFSPGSGSVELTYDTGGRVTALQDTRIPYEYAHGGDTFHYEYDKNDRLTTTTYPDGAKIVYAYDSTRRRTSMTDPDGNVTQYGYGTGSNSKALTSIQHPLSGQTIFNYFANGQLESEYREGNGGVETWEYDALKRPMRHTSYGSGGARINQESYTYNSAWMRTRIDRASDTGLVPASTSKEYGYDSSDRFVSEREVNNATSATIYQQAFNYDDAGNRTAWNEFGTTMPFEFNAMNQMTAGGGLECGYDENGNMQYRTDDYDNPSFLHWFTHDSSGRLVLFEDIFGGTRMNFAYDTSGRMIYRTMADGKMLKYYYDGNNAVLVKESINGTDWYTKIVYTLAPGDIHQIIAESRTACPSDWTGTGLTRWYHYDLAGSVVALSDDTGTAMVQYDQDAYGISSGAFGSNRRHLTGKEYDPDMGLYYFGTRWYDPYTAQWIEPEPTGTDGPNLYWNVLSDPVNWYDPDGKESEPASPQQVAVVKADGTVVAPEGGPVIGGGWACWMQDVANVFGYGTYRYTGADWAADTMADGAKRGAKVVGKLGKALATGGTSGVTDTAKDIIEDGAKDVVKDTLWEKVKDLWNGRSEQSSCSK